MPFMAGVRLYLNFEAVRNQSVSNARHHHYLSQCYLKGFTQGNAKKSKLAVIDLEAKKMFETIPRNVGGIRDFNRVEIEGVDPNIIEKMQSDFEGQVATALKQLQRDIDFSDGVKNLVLNFIAMLTIRTPEMREHLAKPQIESAKRMMAMSLESEERWQAQIDKIKNETGKDLSDGFTYDQMKKFVEGQEYKLEIKQEHQIHIELMGMERILELLHFRNWKLIIAKEDAGEFITTDNPVCLSWQYPEKVPSYMSPGFGLKNTMVYFPLTKKLALLGEFDREDGISEANKQLVAMLNSKIIANSYKRIFASKCNFNYIAVGHQLVKGNKLLKKD
jgi:hypothetical protein